MSAGAGGAILGELERYVKGGESRRQGRNVRPSTFPVAKCRCRSPRRRSSGKQRKPNHSSASKHYPGWKQHPEHLAAQTPSRSCPRQPRARRDASGRQPVICVGPSPQEDMGRRPWNHRRPPLRTDRRVCPDCAHPSATTSHPNGQPAPAHVGRPINGAQCPRPPRIV